MLNWEKVKERASEETEFCTYRASVPGGWLVTVWFAEHSHAQQRSPSQGRQPRHGAGLTFVPDPDHAWDRPAQFIPAAVIGEEEEEELLRELGG